MTRAPTILLVLLATSAQAIAQNTPPPKNGVITPGDNVDPGMKVMPPKAPARTPVVRPPGRARSDRHHHVEVVPK